VIASEPQLPTWDFEGIVNETPGFRIAGIEQAQWHLELD
jgi:hypothetical protein